MKTWITILLVGAAVDGCGTVTGDPVGDPAVALTLSPSRPVPGDSATLTLRNRTTEDIGYNLCTSGLQRRDGTAWIPVPEDRVCTLELRSLRPGDEDSFTLAVPDTISGEAYRYVTNIEHLVAGRSDSASTEEFRPQQR